VLSVFVQRTAFSFYSSKKYEFCFIFQQLALKKDFIWYSIDDACEGRNPAYWTLISNSKIIFYSNWVVKNHRTIKFFLPFNLPKHDKKELFCLHLFCMSKYSHRKNISIVLHFHKKNFCTRTCKSSWIFNHAEWSWSSASSSVMAILNRNVNFKLI
jgi:hypothetical protein